MVTNYDSTYPSKAKLLRSINDGLSFECPIVIYKTSCDCCKTTATASDANEVNMLWQHANYAAKETYSNDSNPYNYEGKLGQGVIYEVMRYLQHSFQ